MERYLTKSRFKLALSCPTKLFYTKKNQYADVNISNDFLEALAEGGYQVGALAQCYFPEGKTIDGSNYDEQLQQTARLLKQENVVLFEGAFRFNSLFIRADIIEKIGNKINLIEVKAKSIDGYDETAFLSARGSLSPKWKEYIYDVAFQKYVISQAYPDFEVNSYLMLANKNAIATVNGLNQKFVVKIDNENRKEVEIVGDVSKEALGDEILICINVDGVVQGVFDGNEKNAPEEDYSFVRLIQIWEEKYRKDEKIITSIQKGCKDCEFRATNEQELDGKLSGFKECWKEQLGWEDEDFDVPSILDVWDFRAKDKLIAEGKYFMRDLDRADIGDFKPGLGFGLTRNERQWKQIEMTADNNNEPYIDLAGLEQEFLEFEYPLHFIDFETSTVAIPFFKGRKPYEQMAFQYSHHIVNKNSMGIEIEHKGQYLCEERGVFPNFDFLRNLKRELESDNGTIFRYAPHENTVLNQIREQLIDSDINIVPDKQELLDFILDITYQRQGKETIMGSRVMVDLLVLVKKYFYHPLMGGSNSIKAVLPAVLSSSDHIQKKYSQPIYGRNSQIKSLNFEDGTIWVQKDLKGEVINPYKLLTPLLDDIDDKELELFFKKNNIQDGGAAMVAYTKLQFSNISEIEKGKIIEGLLRYCELDTLAMVFIWEYWYEIIHQKQQIIL